MKSSIPSRRTIGHENTVADVAILTIIPEAYEAVRVVFGLTHFQPQGGYEWARGSMRVKGRPVTVVAGLALDRENVAAATFANAMLDAWGPRHLLLVDIGGAVKGRDDVQLGDVVIHTHLHYYDFKKETGGLDDSPRHLPHAAPSTRLRELSRRPGLRGDLTWIEMIPARRPTKGRPKVLPGEMLVGGTLFANSPQLKRLLKKHPKVLAVEMEGVGVARSVLDWSARGDVPEFLILRGMSDFCNVPHNENQRMRDRWKLYAAGAAAAHAYALVAEMAPSGGSRETTQGLDWHGSSIDNLWQAPSQKLTGRDGEVARLRDFFSGAHDKGAAAKCHIICGEAGMGKSVIAREVAGHVESAYRIRWWIESEDETQIRTGLRSLAQSLGIKSAFTLQGEDDEHRPDAHRYLRELRNLLYSDELDGRALIILDNVDDPELKHALPNTVLKYLPESKVDVLITSQSRRWHPIGRTTQLSGLRPDVGARLIAVESEIPTLATDPDVEEISSLFGGRPLLLKQVATMLRDGDDPARFLDMLNGAPENAIDALPEIEGFDPLWRKTYCLALQRAESSRAGVRHVLETLACWGPEPIPERLINSLRFRGFGQGFSSAALTTLFDRSLIDRSSSDSQQTYSVHRIVAAIVRRLAFEQSRLDLAFDIAADGVLGLMSSDKSIAGDQDQQANAAIAPHASALVHNAMSVLDVGVSPSVARKIAECAKALGFHLWNTSEWSSLEDLYRDSIRLFEYAGDAGSAAIQKVRYATILRQRGDFELANHLISDALPVLKTHADSCDYAWGLTADARLLRHRPGGSPQVALTRLYHALRILEESERKADAEITRFRSEVHGYISVLHRQLADLDAAETHAKNGLQLVSNGAGVEQILDGFEGPDDHIAGIHLRALGGIWRLRGEFKRSMAAQKLALQIFENAFGPEHMYVSRSLDSLGRVQREWGDLVIPPEFKGLQK